MKKTLVGVLLTIIVIVASAMVYISTIQEEYPANTTTTQANTTTALDYYAIVNKEREKAGVPPLAIDERLTASAQAKADELAREGWDDTPHVSQSGKHGYEYIKDQNIPNCVGGENLLAFQTSAKAGVNWWLNSPSHRNAMLSPNYTITGFGITEDFVVEHFCQ